MNDVEAEKTDRELLMECLLAFRAISISAATSKVAQKELGFSTGWTGDAKQLLARQMHNRLMERLEPE